MAQGGGSVNPIRRVQAPYSLKCQLATPDFKYHRLIQQRLDLAQVRHRDKHLSAGLNQLEKSLPTLVIHLTEHIIDKQQRTGTGFMLEAVHFRQTERQCPTAPLAL